ncbi:MAG: 4-(cytidine 5'-diphospho)-2-C-methyl-D-erythritol kinase [Chitinophagaceae bacterium]|nr:4-(cytidine 5'-diphospho)-2-C-methyl-D-erythritol kinase [Chitinophagaceae bacterium]
MIVFPNCKINLGLNIVKKRKDGYHDLETVFYPLGLKDALEVIKDEGGKEQGSKSKGRDTMPKKQEASENESGTIKDVRFSKSGIGIDGKDEQNLCIKAYQLLKKDFPDLPAVQIHLHKAIPTGAGLGGGSADGAFTLQLLNQKFNLNIPAEKLIDYALQLGSDCPFFIINKPCFATGRGEFLQKINLYLSAFSFLLVNPGIHISTTWAFSKLTPHPSAKPVKEVIEQPIETWKAELINDFEPIVFDAYPEIRAIKETMYYAGAVYSSMTGSGSTVFGIFPKNRLPQLFGDKSYIVKEIM